MLKKLVVLGIFFCLLANCPLLAIGLGSGLSEDLLKIHDRSAPERKDVYIKINELLLSEVFYKHFMESGDSIFAPETESQDYGLNSFNKEYANIIKRAFIQKIARQDVLRIKDKVNQPATDLK